MMWKGWDRKGGREGTWDREGERGPYPPPLGPLHRLLYIHNGQLLQRCYLIFSKSIFMKITVTDL
jgi:hypothetical protein